MRVSYLLCSSHFFEAILVFSKNLNSFSLPIFVLNRYSIDFWSLSNPSNASTLSARYSEHSSTKWVGFWIWDSLRQCIVFIYSLGAAISIILRCVGPDDQNTAQTLNIHISTSIKYIDLRLYTIVE